MDCERCGATMTEDRTTGDPTCLPCARRRAGEQTWRDGIQQARRALEARA